VHIHARFSKNVQDHRRLSKTILTSQALIGKPKTRFLKRVTGRIGEIRSDVIGACRNSTFDVPQKNTGKKS
jgi:hypothetical protein